MRPSRRECFVAVVPAERFCARAGTHTPQAINSAVAMGPRVRGDDSGEAFAQSQSVQVATSTRRHLDRIAQYIQYETVPRRQTENLAPAIRQGQEKERRAD